MLPDVLLMDGNKKNLASSVDADMVTGAIENSKIKDRHSAKIRFVTLVRFFMMKSSSEILSSLKIG